MDEAEIKSVFKNYQPVSDDFSVQPLTSGHINKTFLVCNKKERFLLQKLNTTVFKNLEDIMQNILAVSTHLKKKDYPYEILSPIATHQDEILVENQWRLFPFIRDTATFEQSQSRDQVYETAKFLSEFYNYINDLEPEKIKDSIPGFIDFESRFEQFEESLKTGNSTRLKRASREIEIIQAQKEILEKWELLLPKIPTRVIHADPKISNFLFDQDCLTQIKALIDWDTFMQGTILYDFGDMVRSYTNLKEEDDPNSPENFSAENYEALLKGFLYHLGEELTPTEINNFDLAGQAVIYVQAVRFLTDYLNDDVYYAVERQEHNLDRTKSQLNLLKGLQSYLL